MNRLTAVRILLAAIAGGAIPRGSTAAAPVEDLQESRLQPALRCEGGCKHRIVTVDLNSFDAVNVEYRGETLQITAAEIWRELTGETFWESR